MNNTVTLSQLITRLAKVADTDTNTARRFLRSFFMSLEDSLAAGEEVTIKGIGTFRRSTDTTFGAASGVAFIPDSELANEINAPFEMFEPVELADGADFSEVPDELPSPEPEADAEPEPIVVQEPIEEPEVNEPQPEPEPEEEEDEKDEEKIEIPTYTPTPSSYEEDDSDDDDTPTYIPQQKKNSKIWLWVALIIAVGAIGGFIAASILFDYDEVEIEETEEIEALPIHEIDINEVATNEPTSEEVIVKELTQEVAAEPEAAPAATVSEPRYDTVTKSRYLATMAREYYGVGLYWVFIYQANTDILTNPNRIKPGTRVVIPDKNSFAEATEKETRRKAERIQAELNKKYR